MAGAIAALSIARPAWGQPLALPAAQPHPERVSPPPINVDYLQFGVAFTGEFNLNPGAICPDSATAPCILGSGGGLVARAGYRSHGPWYVGAAYEFDRVNTNSLMRMGVLQQLRGEMRFLFDFGQRTEPYITAGLGAAAFGNEWGVETGGVTTSFGAGFEVQLSRTTVVGAALMYRPVLLFGWTDRAGQLRDTGIAHFVGLEMVLEARQQLASH